MTFAEYAANENAAWASLARIGQRRVAAEARYFLLVVAALALIGVVVGLLVRT